MEPSFRIANQKPYFFSTLNDHIRFLQSQTVDVIRLDMGSPDLPPAGHIIAATSKSLQKPDVHGYTPYGGIPRFREAVAEMYQRRFHVSLDPQSEVLGLIGSKEGIFNLSQALLNPGDLVLAPSPSYPSYASSARAAGAEVYTLPLLEELDYLPDLESIPGPVARRAKILWLNYPNNPTGAVATLEDCQRFVDYARFYDLLLIHDAPYTEVAYDGFQPPSVLQVPGAREVAVELNSLSKAYNMAGWRLGMAVGNREALTYLHTMKLKVDSSHFLPLQEGGVVALTGDQSWIVARNADYAQRIERVMESLDEAGLMAKKPKAALYVWVRLPPGEDDQQFCRRLLDETGVSITPGSVFGGYGAGYARISICTPESRIIEAMGRMVNWIKAR